MDPFYIFLLVMALLLARTFILYNSLINARVLSDEAWIGVLRQLKHRLDLIPGLVETVKASNKEQSDTLERVVQLRYDAMYSSPLDVKAQVKADTDLSECIQSVLALTEHYPDLKANPNFATLKEAMQKAEKDLQNSRHCYNAIVHDYNSKCESASYVFIADFFQFSKKDFFQPENPEASQNVKTTSDLTPKKSYVKAAIRGFVNGLIRVGY